MHPVTTRMLTNRSIGHYFYRFALMSTLLFSLIFGFAFSAHSLAAPGIESLVQPTAPTQTTPPAPPLPPATISLSDIPSKAAAERPLLDQAAALLDQSSSLKQIQKNLNKEIDAITLDLTTLNKSLAAATSRDAISEIEKKWLEFDRQMTNSEAVLHEKTETISLQNSQLASRLELWKRSLAQARLEKAPSELLKLTNDTVNDINNAFVALQKAQNEVLTLQGKLGRTHRLVQAALDKIKTEEADLLSNLGQKDRPALWSEEISSISFNDLTTGAINETHHWWSSIIQIINDETDKLSAQIILFSLAAFALFWIRKAARACIIANPTVEVGTSIFERPISLATLFALLLTPWLYISTSPALIDAMGLLLIIPVLWLVLPLLDAPIRPALYFLGGLYVVDWLRDLVDAEPTIGRFIFIFEMLATIGLILWLIRIKALHGSTSRWQILIRFFLKFALFIMTISIITDIAGYVRLSVLLGYGVLNSAYLAVLFAALIRATDATLALMLYSRLGQAIHVIQTRTEKLRRLFKTLFGILFVFIWFQMTLEQFALWDYTIALINTVLFTKLHAGSISISLGDVMAFFIMITVSIYLARFITTVLDEDVYQRVELGRGISFAISAVIKYSIIVLGFLLAVGAMGIGMDRITILLGALSVGIGFGLQTIVNNFISGMILIFERPIQIGDAVEVGAIKGNITRIGIRSSTVRSFDGAEVTVPNGSLLSDNVTNWTLSDRSRRIEIPVGVAYGTDTNKVIEALRSAVEGQEGILLDPEPQILLTGFGDNSLNFLLRAWVADNDDFVIARSNVALAINQQLQANGIEIPFPQRDLHLRSIAPEIKIPSIT